MINRRKAFVLTGIRKTSPRSWRISWVLREARTLLRALNDNQHLCSTLKLAKCCAYVILSSQRLWEVTAIIFLCYYYPHFWSWQSLGRQRLSNLPSHAIRKRLRVDLNSSLLTVSSACSYPDVSPNLISQSLNLLFCKMDCYRFIALLRGGHLGNLKEVTGICLYFVLFPKTKC